MANNKSIKLEIKVKHLAFIIPIVIVVCLLLAGGIYCATTDQNPNQAVNTILGKNEELIIGKWQNQAKPGSTAFQFFDDGTYDSYFLQVNFPGEYKIENSKLYLTNPQTKKDIVYSFTVTDEILKLKTVEEDGKPSETEETVVYEKVDEFHQQSLNDLIGELAQSSEKTTDE